LDEGELQNILDHCGTVQKPAVGRLMIRTLSQLGAPWPDVIHYCYTHKMCYYNDEDDYRWSWTDENVRYARRKGCEAPLILYDGDDTVHEASFYDADAQETIDLDSDGDTI
jgi:hypothetical protein